MPETVDAHVVHWPDEDLDLGLDSGGLVLVGRLAEQARVLGESLGEQNVQNSIKYLRFLSTSK